MATIVVVETLFLPAYAMIQSHAKQYNINWSNTRSLLYSTNNLLIHIVIMTFTLYLIFPILRIDGDSRQSNYIVLI
jgi:hypothetical protein